MNRKQRRTGPSSLVLPSPVIRLSPPPVPRLAVVLS